ncbi:MAG: hypothetical protein FWD66_00495 [Paludibacter sp.]|nr:hypothetical protein [Paludibacter sp.]
MKRIFTILGILILGLQTGIFAQISATMTSQKEYDNGTRICYFTTDKYLTQQAKDYLKQKAQENENINRLSFGSDNSAMFDSNLNYTLESVTAFINENINILSSTGVEVFSSIPPPQNALPQSICDVISPVCADNMNVNFPAVVGELPGMGHIGCLSTTPNATWFWFQIGSAGDMTIYISGLYDMDFICWGPFNSLIEGCQQIDLGLVCSCPNNTTDPNYYPYDNIVDCSYSANPYENVHINNAQSGQIYILLITNYHNAPMDINFHQTAGNATTDCSILPPPINNNGPLCEGETLYLTAQPSTEPGAVYNWTGPNGFTSNEQNPVIPNVTTANSGTYSLTIIAGGQTSNAITMEVVIYPLNNKTVNATICSGETYNFYGTPITQAGTYTTQVHGILCDTVVTLNLDVDIRCNIVTFEPVEDICADNNQIGLDFSVSNGMLTAYSSTFSSKANMAGFENTSMHSINGNIIPIPLPHNVRPDYYSVTVDCKFERGENRQYVIDFTVLYPSAIITQRWNDLLAIKNSIFNGGYEFSNYEWYKDGEMIAGANDNFLYVGANGDQLDFNAEYRARPTRLDDGVQIFTCGKKPIYVENINVIPNMIQMNNQIIVNNLNQKAMVTIWNIMGMRTGQYQISKENNSFPAPVVAGTYAVSVEMGNGERYVDKIVIK